MTEYVSTPVSAAVSFLVPLVVMGAFGLWGTRDFGETNAAVGYFTSTSTSPYFRHPPSSETAHGISAD